MKTNEPINFTYQDLFQNAPIGIFKSSPDGILQTANRTLLKMLGCDLDPAEIHKHADLVAQLELDADQCAKIAKDYCESDKLLNYQKQLRRPDGSVILAELNMRAERNGDGSVAYLEGFVQDVSDRRQIARALVESEKHYKSIFEITGAGTIIIEDDMTISLANACFERISGYSKAEIEGKAAWPRLIAFEQDRERMMQYHQFRRKNPGDAPTRYEFILKDKSGRLKNILLSVDMISGTTRSVASLIDITSLKEAEKMLLESESRLSGIVEAFDGFIYTCGKDFEIGFMNMALLKSLPGKPGPGPCHQVIFQMENRCPWCKIDAVFAGQTIQEEFEHPVNGRWYYAMSKPVIGTKDTIDQCQSILIDIHDRKQRELEIQQREARLLEVERDRYRLGDIIGKSAPMQKVYELIMRAAATSANVIIYGESGTGKELVAHAIHKLSPRSNKRFMPVNCGAIPPDLLESEFFGYKKGAFTGAAADKPGILDLAGDGTLFLDELAEISPSIQVKLLRAIEGGGYTPVGGQEVKKPDIRIIAATNGNLRKLVEKGDMREDFFYRIHIIPIYLPPLRERKEDIPLLMEHFLQKISGKGKVRQLPGNAIDAMLRHQWPGNVRELENALQRYVELGYIEFPETLNRSGYQVETDGAPLAIQPLRDAIDGFEKSYLLQVLEKVRWNRRRAAEMLGIERKTLYLKLKKLGIE
jgi:PAS domain S-box-containing protein